MFKYGKAHFMIKGYLLYVSKLQLFPEEHTGTQSYV